MFEDQVVHPLGRQIENLQSSLDTIRHDTEEVIDQISNLRADIRDIGNTFIHLRPQPEPRVFERWMLAIICGLLIYALFFRH